MQAGDALAPGTAHLALWIYMAASLLLMLLVRHFRFAALQLLKTLWVTFTIAALAWTVMMSGTTNEVFMHHPGGFFEQLSEYPAAFSRLFGVDGWWLPATLLLPIALARRLTDQTRTTSKGTRLRRASSVALGAIAALLVAPLVLLAAEHDWSAYAHFARNYGHAWRVGRMGDYFFNSVLVSASAVGLVSVLGSMAAFGLSRLRFAGRRVIFGVLVGAMAVPAALLMVPLFLTLKDWAIGPFSFSNSRVGLAVIYAAISLPFTTFLLAAFYDSLPEELAQAAVMDGASPWRVFTEVYFPLAAPGLATTAIFNFLGAWNEYHFALVFLTNAEFKTLPVGLYNLQVSQTFAVNWPAMFAGIVILALPTFLIFVLLQERIVAGITVGGLKN